MEALHEALSNYGLNHAVSMVVCTRPDNFIYAGVLQVLKSKPAESATIMAEIIAKCEMLVAPGDALNELEDVLG